MWSSRKPRCPEKTTTALATTFPQTERLEQPAQGTHPAGTAALSHSMHPPGCSAQTDELPDRELCRDCHRGPQCEGHADKPPPRPCHLRYGISRVSTPARLQSPDAGQSSRNRGPVVCLLQEVLEMWAGQRQSGARRASVCLGRVRILAVPR